MAALVVLWDGVIFAIPSVSSYGLADTQHKWPHSQRPFIRTVKDRVITELLELESNRRLCLKPDMCINIEDIVDIVPDISRSKLNDKPYLWIKLNLISLRQRGLINYLTNAYYLKEEVKIGYFPLVRTMPDQDIEQLVKKFENLPRSKDDWPDYTHPNDLKRIKRTGT